MDTLQKPITMTAVVDRWVMYTDASGNERPAHVVRETKIDGVTVLGVEAAGPGLVWVPIDRVIRSAATQLDLVPADALNALAGTWPGDETDEELAGAMREWDGHGAELDATRARAEDAEAQLAALREADPPGVYGRVLDILENETARADAAEKRADAADAQLGRLVAQFSGVLEVVRQARDAFGKVRPHDETAWPERAACTSAWDALAVAAKDEHYRTIAKAHTLSVRAETLGWVAERLRDLIQRGHPEALSAAWLVEELALAEAERVEAGR